MKNREPKEWRISQRWLRLQKRAQKEKSRGKLVQIFGKMECLVVQIEKRGVGHGLMFEAGKDRQARSAVLA
jgi:hypothetical protein